MRTPLKLVENVSQAIDVYGNPCGVGYGAGEFDQGMMPSMEQCAVDVALAKQRISASQYMIIPMQAKILAGLLGVAVGIYFAFKG